MSFRCVYFTRVSNNPTPLLQTHNLSVGYTAGGQTLLEQLNLQLHAGEMVCFMGRNGIGKSTLIRTLAGLQAPLAGRVSFPSSIAAQPATDIAVVLTEKISAVSMTVHELVTYGRYPYLNWSIRLNAADKTIVEEAINRVGIQTLVARKLYQLSDGQLQMAMIARALAQTTPIVLLDEPTAHLDLNNRIEIMRLLRNLARQSNRAILVATHELDLALQTADRVWLAGKNKEVITGLPEDLVLDGTFDNIFEFKGFDLKTGTVQHEPHRAKTIQLTGTGSDYQWTKNALERNGFNVTNSPTQDHVTILKNGDNLAWAFGGQTFQRLEHLLQSLH
jgi:iron complex transport system ATP-binding protein